MQKKIKRLINLKNDRHNDDDSETSVNDSESSVIDSESSVIEEGYVIPSLRRQSSLKETRSSQRPPDDVVQFAVPAAPTLARLASQPSVCSTTTEYPDSETTEEGHDSFLESYFDSDIEHDIEVVCFTF